MLIKTDAQRKKEQRDRTAKSRQKAKEQKAAEALADEELRREERCARRLAVSGEIAASEEFLFAEYMNWRRENHLVFPGEIAPDENALTCADGLQISREFLLALHKPGMKSGESLLDVEKRVLIAWAEAGGPLLNRNTRKLELSVAGPAFEYDFDKWSALEGADLPITDITPLPAIVHELVEVSAIVEVSPTIEDTVTPAVPDFPPVEEEDNMAPIEAAIARAQLREERASSID
jgi:hypothetical protein